MSDLLGTSPPPDWAPPTLAGTSVLSASPDAGNPLIGSGVGSAPPTSPEPPHTLLNYAKSPTPVAGSPSSGDFVSVAPSADVADLNPEFAKRASALQRAAKAAGIDTTVVSGYRSAAHQAELYAAYKSGKGGLAAPPGMSYHNYGDAVDMYASNPKDQAWLVANAPKFGIYPGANFGDPGHFQIAGANPGGDHGTSVGTPHAGEETPASASVWKPPEPEAPANPADLIRSEMKLALLRNMFPQHSITPVEHDPWKTMPQGLGEKVDVNRGVG